MQPVDPQSSSSNGHRVALHMRSGATFMVNMSEFEFYELTRCLSFVWSGQGDRVPTLMTFTDRSRLDFRLSSIDVVQLQSIDGVMVGDR